MKILTSISYITDPGYSSVFLTGFPYIVAVVTLPERFQTVNGASSLMAGVYLLPLLGASAVGSYLGGAISSKRNLTSYTLIVSALLQMAGCGLLSTIGDAINIMPRQYVFEAILGLGIGLSLSTATIMTSVQAKRGDLGESLLETSKVSPYRSYLRSFKVMHTNSKIQLPLRAQFPKFVFLAESSASPLPRHFSTEGHTPQLACFSPRPNSTLSTRPR